MAVQLSPTSVPQHGASGHLALAGFVVALGVIVAIGVLGEGVGSPSPQGAVEPIPPPVSTAQPRWPYAVAAQPSPTPAPACVTPRIDSLSGPIPRHPRGLLATGLETMTPPTGVYDTIIPDATGGLWAYAAGRLTRLDATGRQVATWTFEDDASFASAGIAAARGRGVWLFTSRDIRWFDGERFGDVVPAPASGLSDVAEGPDGALWAARFEGGVFRWDGRTWTAVCGQRPALMTNTLEVGPDGAVWASGSGGWAGPAWVARYDGRAWTTYQDAFATALVSVPGGTVWAGWEGGLARFDGTSWSVPAPAGVDLTGIASLAVAPDGTLWAAAGRVDRTGGWGQWTSVGAGVVRFDGRSWTVYGRSDGLPGLGPNAWATVTSVAVSGGHVFAATWDGLYELRGERWARVEGPARVAPVWPGELVAVSSGEAWAVDGRLWHLADGDWTEVAVSDWPTGATVRGVARSSAGVLAVAGDAGLAVLEGGRWLDLSDGGGIASVAFSPDGKSLYGWVSGWLTAPPAWWIRRFDRAADGWRQATVTPIDSAIDAYTVAVGANGDLWVGGAGMPTVLARLNGTTWDDVGPIGGTASVQVNDLEPASNGDMWTTAFTDRGDGVMASLVGRYRGGRWTMFGPADGFVTNGVWRLASAPDGSVLAAADEGLLRFDGRGWTVAVEGSGLSAVDVADDGTVWTIGPSGIGRLPASLATLEPRLSEAEAAWCLAAANRSAFSSALAALAIDEAKMEARAALVAAARGRAEDAVGIADALRTDVGFVRACSAAYAAAH